MSGLLDDARRDGHAWTSPLFAIVLGITRCFEYLHFELAGDPLLHRDLKPANVLISADMTAKVADFGCSRRFDAMAVRNKLEEYNDAVLSVELGLETTVVEGTKPQRGSLYRSGQLAIELGASLPAL